MKPDKSWKVIYLQEARQAIVKLYELAAARGRRPEVRQAARQIHMRLHSDPDVYGEEIHHYHEMKLLVRVAIEDPLVIRYGVHEVLPLVFVKAIAPLPGKGLD